MARTKFKNGPDLNGWILASMAGVVAFAACVAVGDFGLMAAAAIGAVIFLVVGLILGMPVDPLPRAGEVSFSSAASVAKPGGKPQVSSVPPMAVAGQLPPTPMPPTSEAGVGKTEPVAIVAAAAPGSAFVAMVPGAPSGPARLNAPRNGVSDDLKEIEGIGPALESLCNEMGFYHFDQISEWTDADVAWVDDNMPRFKGRIVRDRWVPQARLIVIEGLEAFRIRVRTNDY
jgi:predicted flap endonuclease-1-like 5' DNA nuclease